RTANYSHLPPGDYRFRVIACNDDGLWNEQGAELAFTLAPFFYQTRWFNAAVRLSGVVIVVGGHRLRVRALLCRQRELARCIAQRTAALQAETAGHVRTVAALTLATAAAEAAN